MTVYLPASLMSTSLITSVWSDPLSDIRMRYLSPLVSFTSLCFQVASLSLPEIVARKTAASCRASNKSCNSRVIFEGTLTGIYEHIMLPIYIAEKVSVLQTCLWQVFARYQLLMLIIVIVCFKRLKI